MACAIALTAALASLFPHAALAGGYASTLGLSEQCAAIGGACVATDADLSAYYSNPASATQFTRPLLGGSFRVIDTRHLRMEDSDGNHAPEATNTKGEQALAPTLAAYLPIDDRWVVGIAFGAPFAITGSLDRSAGIHRYNSVDQALFLLDLTPMVAFRVNDDLSLGLALSVTALKHLRIQSLIPDTFLAGLPAEMGGTGSNAPATPTSPTVGSITLQTNKDVHLGIPPDNFESGFKEASLTFGLKYRLNDAVTLGGVYRTITRTHWHGDASIQIPGVVDQTTPFSVALDMPGRAQAGVAVVAIPNLLTWSFDYERTFWSQTRGLGTPTNVKFKEPLLGVVQRLRLDYAAHDTSTFRTGAKFRVSRQLELMMGYAYDEGPFDNQHVDIVVYDSDRHILSVGATLDLRDSPAAAGWLLSAALQQTHYQRRTVAKGESQNLGGVSHPNLNAEGTLGFTSNDDAFTFGGNIWAFGASLQYSF